MKAIIFVLLSLLCFTQTWAQDSQAAQDAPYANYQVQEFLDKLNSGGGTPIEQLTPAEARDVLTKAQEGAELPPADVSSRLIDTDVGEVNITIVKPQGASYESLPVFMFFHGGGWVLGDFFTHERFVRDLVTMSGLAAVFVNYTPSPEAQFPTAINQAYAATAWVAENCNEIGVDGSRLGIVGNSVGGNMVAAVAQQAKQQGGPTIKFQVMMWPVTNANFSTESYNLYPEGFFLTKNMMEWFWDNYAPDQEDRANILASPLLASLEELEDLPPALIQTAELDVLRDEGEAYARKLDAAGVEVISVRYNGLIHDFGLLNPLSQIPAVRSALLQVAVELARRL